MEWELEDISDVKIVDNLLRDGDSPIEKWAEGTVRIWIVLRFEDDKLRSVFTYPTRSAAENIIKLHKHKFKLTNSKFVIVDDCVLYTGTSKHNKLEKF